MNQRINDDEEINAKAPGLTAEQREVAEAFEEADRSLDEFDEACNMLHAALDSVGAKKMHEIPDYRIRD